MTIYVCAVLLSVHRYDRIPLEIKCIDGIHWRKGPYVRNLRSMELIEWL